MHSRALLITFDAFGTLFSPRWPIAVQYAKVAKQQGLVVTKNDIEDSFKNALKKTSTIYPNYGKNSDLDSEGWWAKIIEATFTPYLPAGQSLPSALAPALMKHFSSSDAYALHPIVPTILKSIRTHKSYTRTVVGVVSNSDPRIHGILRSLGLAVGADEASPEQGKIDFVTLSYEIGFEKPDPRIFQAADEEGKQILGLKDGEGWAEMIHIGDDLFKDVQGAKDAGWSAVLWEDFIKMQNNDREIDLARWLGEDSLSKE